MPPSATLLRGSPLQAMPKTQPKRACVQALGELSFMRTPPRVPTGSLSRVDFPLELLANTALDLTGSERGGAPRHAAEHAADIVPRPPTVRRMASPVAAHSGQAVDLCCYCMDALGSEKDCVNICCSSEQHVVHTQCFFAHVRHTQESRRTETSSASPLQPLEQAIACPYCRGALSGCAMTLVEEHGAYMLLQQACDNITHSRQESENLWKLWRVGMNSENMAKEQACGPSTAEEEWLRVTTAHMETYIRGAVDVGGHLNSEGGAQSDVFAALRLLHGALVRSLETLMVRAPHKWNDACRDLWVSMATMGSPMGEAWLVATEFVRLSRSAAALPPGIRVLCEVPATLRNTPQDTLTNTGRMAASKRRERHVEFLHAMERAWACHVSYTVAQVQQAVHSRGALATRTPQYLLCVTLPDTGLAMTSCLSKEMRCVDCAQVAVARIVAVQRLYQACRGSLRVLHRAISAAQESQCLGSENGGLRRVLAWATRLSAKVTQQMRAAVQSVMLSEGMAGAPFTNKERGAFKAFVRGLEACGITATTLRGSQWRGEHSA